MSPILNLVKSKGQRKSKLEVKRKEWKNWYWQHWIQATFPAAPALHPPKHCAGEEQKVRSKTSSTAHLFVLGFIVALAACGAALLFRSLTLQRVLVNSSTLPSYAPTAPTIGLSYKLHNNTSIFSSQNISLISTHYLTISRTGRTDLP